MKNLCNALCLLMLFSLSCKNDVKSVDSNSKQEDSLTLVKRAKAIHDKVITFDMHIDFNVKYTASINYTKDLSSQVTLPKMKAAGLDVAWFIVYTVQDIL